jgi:hypothetical protein
MNKRRQEAERMAREACKGEETSAEMLDAIATEIEKSLDENGEIIIPNGRRETYELIAGVVRDTLRPITAEEAGV